MINRTKVILLFLLTGQISFAQKIDTAIYGHLLNANKDEFTRYAQSAGLTTEFDSKAAGKIKYPNPKYAPLNYSLS